MIHFRMLYLIMILVFAAHTHQAQSAVARTPREQGMTLLEPGEKHPRCQGSIIGDRYYAPYGLFSCKAENFGEDFGEGQYIVQDLLKFNPSRFPFYSSMRLISYDTALVAFYNLSRRYKKAQVFFLHDVDVETINMKTVFLEDAFNCLCFKVIKELTLGGTEILRKEMISDRMLFVALSEKNRKDLVDSKGNFQSATQGYLVFLRQDMVVVLYNQYVTVAGERHQPQEYVEELQKELLEFKETLQFPYCLFLCLPEKI